MGDRRPPPIEVGADEDGNESTMEERVGILGHAGRIGERQQTSTECTAVGAAGGTATGRAAASSEEVCVDISAPQVPVLVSPADHGAPLVVVSPRQARELQARSDSLGSDRVRTGSIDSTFSSTSCRKSPRRRLRGSSSSSTSSNSGKSRTSSPKRKESPRRQGRKRTSSNLSTTSKSSTREEEVQIPSLAQNSIVEPPRENETTAESDNSETRLNLGSSADATAPAIAAEDLNLRLPEGQGTGGLFLSSVPLSPTTAQQNKTNDFRFRPPSGSTDSLGKGKQRASSVDSATSKSSLSSVLSGNMRRVLNVSSMYNVRQRGHGSRYSHSRGSRGSSVFSEEDDDISSSSEVEWSTRIIQRDNVFHQSTGEIHVDQIATRRYRLEIQSLYLYDWFHRVLAVPIGGIMLGMTLLYTAYLLVFAGFYYYLLDAFRPECAFDPDATRSLQFQVAFAFALENAGTIGYGFPFPGDGNNIWNGCWRFPTIIWIQAFIGILINALSIGIVVTRMGKAESRSSQVVFSDKAAITFSDGEFHLSFQVYDLSGNPTPEAHVRAYVVLNESDGVSTANFQTRHMRLQNPNDELGGALFLSVPCTVVHNIDQWSPLLPPAMRREHWATHNDNFVHSAGNRLIYPGINCREGDSAILSRRGSSCPVCGMNLHTDELLLRHVRYHKFMENDYGIDADESEDSDNEDEGKSDAQTIMTGTSAIGAPSPAKLIPKVTKRLSKSTSEPIGSSADTNVAETSGESEGGPIGVIPVQLIPSAHKEKKGALVGRQPTSKSRTEQGEVNQTKSGSSNGASIPVQSRTQSPAPRSRTPSPALGTPRNRAPRENSFHSTVSARTLRSHHSSYSRRSGSDNRSDSDDSQSHYSHSRHGSVYQDRLKKQYEDEINRGMSTSVHHHHFVRLGGNATVDEQLKELADINKPQDHQNLDMGNLITHDRVVSADQLREEELRASNRTPRTHSQSEKNGGPQGPRPSHPSLARSKVVDDVRSRIRRFIQNSELEIIVQVEGIEARSSDSFQARHSYSLDDIVFDMWFEKCIGTDPESGTIMVDLDKFHKMKPVSEGMSIQSCL